MARRWIIALVLLGCWGGWHHFRQQALQHAAGVIAAAEPRQSAPQGNLRLSHNGHLLQRLQEFHVVARVLSRQDYSLDRESSLSPMDLALGWGRMSDSAVLDQLEIRQASRYYLWKATELPIPRDEINASSANMHLIPADDAVLAQMRQTRSGDLVEFSGALVEARGEHGWIWRSSLSRHDTGAGACELVYVERFAIHR